MNKFANYDTLIIGAELFGLTMAERLVHECNKNVLSSTNMITSAAKLLSRIQ